MVLNKNRTIITFILSVLIIMFISPLHVFADENPTPDSEPPKDPLEVKYEELHSQYGELKITVDNISEQIDVLSQQIANGNASNADLNAIQSQLNSLANQLSSLNSQVSGVQQSQNSTASSMSSLSYDTRNMQSTVNSLRNDVSNLQRNSQTVQQQPVARTSVTMPSVNTAPTTAGVTVNLRTSDNRGYSTSISSTPANTNKAVIVDVVDVVDDNTASNDLNLRLSDSTGISSDLNNLSSDELVYKTDKSMFTDDDIVLVTNDGSYIVGDNVVTHDDLNATVEDDQNFLLNAEPLPEETTSDEVELTDDLEDINLIANTTPQATEPEEEVVEEQKSSFKTMLDNLVASAKATISNVSSWLSVMSQRQRTLLISIVVMVISLGILFAIFFGFAKKNGMLFYSKNAKVPDEDIIDDEQLDEAFAIN